MTRLTFARIARCVLHSHYAVRSENIECLYDGRTHLVLPNHTAYIDPLILFAECAEVPICPLVDERFFRNPVFRRVLALADAVSVPDLEKTRDRRNDATQAHRLTESTVAALAAGRDVAFYPSGHVKTVNREVIGNRRLAYEVCSQLPEDVVVIMVRMSGLERSVWSKLRPKNFRLRREVTLHFEDKTNDLRRWAQEGDRRAFNQHLEEWYNEGRV